MSVLHRAARLDVAQQHAMLFAPGTDGSADKLGPVIDMDFLRHAACFGQLLENPDDAETRKTCVCLNGQTLSRVLVDDRQHTKVRPCAKVSLTKSMAQRWFARPRRVVVAAASRCPLCLRLRLRMASPSSRYIR